jgi:hypothetical protein
MEVAGPAIKPRSCPECRGGSVGFTKWKLRAVHLLLQRNARLNVSDAWDAGELVANSIVLMPSKGFIPIFRRDDGSAESGIC